MSSEPGTSRQLLLQGHEVISHTAVNSNGRHCCLVVLLDPFQGKREVKVFRGFAQGSEEAESQALSRALTFLEFRQVDPATTLTSHSIMDIAGRKVEIFCDVIAENLYQAFPFLRRADGSRALIMQFHLEEAVTGRTPAAALDKCITRLEDYLGSATALELDS